MSNLYGSHEPGGAGTTEISTAFVIFPVSVSVKRDHRGEVTYLPSFDDDTDPGAKENHPTRVLVVIDEVE